MALNLRLQNLRNQSRIGASNHSDLKTIDKMITEKSSREISTELITKPTFVANSGLLVKPLNEIIDDTAEDSNNKLVIIDDVRFIPTSVSGIYIRENDLINDNISKTRRFVDFQLVLNDREFAELETRRSLFNRVRSFK